MWTEWEPDELIGAWTLVEGDWKLIANKTGVTRLGFAVMLKFYEIEGRFPAYPEEIPQAAVGYIASLVKVDPALFAKYSWRGRTIEYHRAQIRKAYGTRPPTEADEDRWARWLAGEICPTESNRDRLAAALLRRCRSEKVEPPTSGQVERVVASGCRRGGEGGGAGTGQLGQGGDAAGAHQEERAHRALHLRALAGGPGRVGGGQLEPGHLAGATPRDTSASTRRSRRQAAIRSVIVTMTPWQVFSELDGQRRFVAALLPAPRLVRCCRALQARQDMARMTKRWARYQPWRGPRPRR